MMMMMMKKKKMKKKKKLCSTVASTPSPMQPTLLSRLLKVSPIPFMHQRMRCWWCWEMKPYASTRHIMVAPRTISSEVQMAKAGMSPARNVTATRSWSRAREQMQLIYGTTWRWLRRQPGGGNLWDLMDFFNVFAVFEVKLLKLKNVGLLVMDLLPPHQLHRHGSCLEVQEPLDHHLRFLAMQPLQVDIPKPRSNDSTTKVFGCMELPDAWRKLAQVSDAWRWGHRRFAASPIWPWCFGPRHALSWSNVCSGFIDSWWQLVLSACFGGSAREQGAPLFRAVSFCVLPAWQGQACSLCRPEDYEVRPRSSTKPSKAVEGSWRVTVKVYPVGISGVHGKICSAEVPGAAPLLLSRPFMQKLGTVIDVGNSTLSH